MPELAKSVNAWLSSANLGLSDPEKELLTKRLVEMVIQSLKLPREKRAAFLEANKGRIIEEFAPAAAKSEESEALVGSWAASQLPAALPLCSDFTDLFLRGVERTAEMQKKSLEAALQQNVEAIASYRKGAAEAVSHLINVFDLASAALESYVQAQKSMIDQIVQQTTVLVEGKKGGISTHTAAELYARDLELSVHRTLEIQKEILALAARRAKEKVKA